ncbi:MAG TPA: HNH endonuclease signature motif containing protein [Tepidisphaeraceae bacterium]|jgi:hypothetical protein
MTSYVPAALRKLVAARADAVCEYCLIHEDDTFFGCHIEHIISEKHGGPTEPSNLAFACAFCNRRKGTDVGSLTDSGTFVRLFNPRTDHWGEHFALNDSRIDALTPIGGVTVPLLALNHPDRILNVTHCAVQGDIHPLRQ